MIDILTYNDIIKALKKSSEYDCDKCWQKGENCDGEYCEHVVSKQILDLINRQKVEIERLEKQSSTFAKRFYKEGIKDFAEKLKSECNGIISNDWNHKAQPVSWAAAYEEFIEDIDRLLNEMVGEES